MKKLHALPLIVSASLGCSSNQNEAQQPSSPIVEVNEVEGQETLRENKPTAKTRPEREPMVVTEEIRKLYYRICQPDPEYKKCVREELRTFFKMEKKVSRAISQVCMASGDFEEGCIEDAYATKFGKDKEYKKLKFLRDECPKIKDQCVDKEIAACKTSHKECAHSQLEEIFGPSRGNPVRSKMDGTWEEINPDGTPTGRIFKRGSNGRLELIE